MKLEFYDSLDEAHEVHTAYVVFKHVSGIVINQEGFTARFVLLLNEVFDLALRVLEDLGVVVFEDALQFLFKHGEYLLRFLGLRIQICDAMR